MVGMQIGISLMTTNFSQTFMYFNNEMYVLPLVYYNNLIKTWLPGVVVDLKGIEKFSPLTRALSLAISILGKLIPVLIGLTPSNHITL